jgi:hypothetical protein
MAKFCCEVMQRQAGHSCEQHPNPWDCPDALVIYISKFDEFGIVIHDGGAAFSKIAFCPWCGAKLPESRRDQWFDELERLRLDPDSDSLPHRFKSDEWYRAQ